MVRLSNSHSQNSHYQLQSLNSGKYKYNVSPNKKISPYTKLKQIPSIKGLYFLKNKHFRGIYLELFLNPVLQSLFLFLCQFCFIFKQRKWRFLKFYPSSCFSSLDRLPNLFPGLLLSSSSYASSSDTFLLHQLSLRSLLYETLSFSSLVYIYVFFFVLNFAQGNYASSEHTNYRY